MAYETGSATDLEDLMSKLDTFITANGFSQDQFNTGTNYASWNDGGSLFFSARWDDSPGTDLGLYQALGFDSAGAPHTQTDDSGNGDTSVPINAERRVNMESAGPYTAYHFFIDAAETYIHVVVEVDTGRFRHFGFGTIDKANDYTGGEYVYGHFWSNNTTYIDDPTSQQHYMGLDGGSGSANGATMHLEGVDGMTVDQKWMVFTQNSSGGTDTAGEDRVTGYGTMRGGMHTNALAWIRGSALNVYVPLIPIEVVYRNKATAPDTAFLLGRLKDIAVINIHNFNAGDEITIGSDTYVIFPWVRKQYSLGNTEESWNAGLAYKKVS